MAALDEYQARQAQADDYQLREAVKSADWSTTFSGPTSPEALRATRNVTQLANEALDRKQRLLATVDKDAADIYAKNQEIREFEQQAPLRDQLLRARISAEGASTRFEQYKQAQTLEQTSRFFDGLIREGAPSPGSPEYKRHVLTLLRDNPGFATTADGKAFVQSIAEEDDIATKLSDIVPPQGTKLSSVTFGKRGSVQQVTLRAEDEEDKTDLDKEAIKAYGVPTTVIKNATGVQVGKIVDGKFQGDSAGDVVQIANPTSKTNIQMSKSEYLRFGGALAGNHQEPVPVPVASPTPTATPNARLVLAQKALDDPNASEAHKAAARKLLGIQ